LFTALLAYPAAMVIAYGKRSSADPMILVVAPLVVSVIVRTYGWQLLLGNSATGVSTGCCMRSARDGRRFASCTRNGRW